MARKHATKPKNHPAVAPTPNQETQIEALVTFLDTGSPLREPVQWTGSPTTIPIPALEGLPQGAYSLPSKEQRARNPVLTQGLHSFGRDTESLERKLEDEGEFLRKSIGKQYNQFRDAQVLYDLREGIGALAGHISNDEQSKLHVKLQSIREQMKVTSLHTKVLLSHPDGSPNENAFEQEAAVQMILLEISDLEMNIKLWANSNTVKAANDTKEPMKEAKELTREKRDERDLIRAEALRKFNINEAATRQQNQLLINKWMCTFNIDEATATQRLLRVHHYRSLANRILEQTFKDAKDAIPKTEPLRIRSGQSYGAVTMPSTATRARDATASALSGLEPVLETESGRRAIQELAGGENMMAADPVATMLKMQEGMSKLREVYSKTYMGQREKPGHRSLEPRMERQELEGLLKLREEHLHKRETQQQEIDELLQKLEKQLHERESRLAEREHDVKNREVEWEKHQDQRQEIEKLLQQREEQLQKRDDQLLIREDQLQGREDQLLSRETLLQRLVVDQEARMATANQQATKIQAEIEEEELQLARLTHERKRAVEETTAVRMELDHRARAVKNQEAAVATRGEWVEQLRMSVHEQLKASMAGAAKPYTSLDEFSTGDWPGVLELAVQVRMFVDLGVEEWGYDEKPLTDLKKAAAKIEEEAKKVIFDDEIKWADIEKLADGKVAPVRKEAKENGATTEQLEGWSGDFSAATSTET